MPEHTNRWFSIYDFLSLLLLVLGALLLWWAVCVGAPAPLPKDVPLIPVREVLPHDVPGTWYYVYLGWPGCLRLYPNGDIDELWNGQPYWGRWEFHSGVLTLHDTNGVTDYKWGAELVWVPRGDTSWQLTGKSYHLVEE